MVYANALASPFVFDDQHAIERNADIRQLWPPTWALPSSELHSAINGRPLTSFSLAVNYALGGLRVEGYRLVNIVLHMLCCLCLYGVLWRLLARVGECALRARELALISALLWGVHPLNSQVVNYITQRGEALMALCYLGTLYCFLRAVVEDRRNWYGAAVLCCILGMTAKEVMVSAPIAVWLCDGLFVCRSYREALRRRSAFYGGLACSWLVLLLELWTTPHGETIGFGLGVDSWTYLLNQSQMLTTYLRLVFWPHPLVLDYGFPRPLGLGDVWWQAGVMVAIAVLCVLGLYRRWRWAFVGIFALLLLAPTSSVVPLVNEVGAERRMYLPLAALVAGLIAWGYAAGRHVQRGLWLRWGLCGLAVVWLGGMTLRRNRDYLSGISIWRSSLAVVEENPRGHYNLAYYLAASDSTERALYHYRRALDLKPGFRDAHFKLGLLLVATGDLSTAVRHYRSALELDPDFVDAHVNIGMAQAVLGEPSEALAHFRRALQLGPGSALIYYHMGKVLEEGGQISEAIGHYEKALSLDPGFAKAHYRLGVVYLAAGQWPNAIYHLRETVKGNEKNEQAHFYLGQVLVRLDSLVEGMGHYRIALELAPTMVEAHFNLATELLKQGQHAAALSHFEQAVLWAPEVPEMRNNLGIALGQLGRYEEAAREFSRALELRPDYEDARRNLAALRPP